ncbi:MAG: hypothetical protein AB8F95_18870 [Bacteroidia bacterium]
MIPTKIYKTNGNGTIAAFYDGHCTWLEIDKELIAISMWGDRQDITDEFFIPVKSTEKVNKILSDVGFNLYGTEEYFNYYEPKTYWPEEDFQFEKLLSYFPPGRYFIDGRSQYSFVEKEYRFCISDFGVVLCTKKQKELNPLLIEKYKSDIERGLYPIVLAYRKMYGSEDASSFLLDGHHKLAAYIEAKKSPNIWEIIEMGPDKYDTLNQEVCSFVDHPEIVEHSLQFEYKIERNLAGKITKLSPRGNS